MKLQPLSYLKAAKQLGISLLELNNLVEKGQLGSYKIKGVSYIDRIDIGIYNER